MRVSLMACYLARLRDMGKAHPVGNPSRCAEGSPSGAGLADFATGQAERITLLRIVKRGDPVALRRDLARQLKQ